jgi:hypothetical protein
VFKALYGLKQSGRVWYPKFIDEKITMGYNQDDIASCIFIKHQDDKLVNIAIYVDDLIIFETPKLTDH